jgi:phage repressor protein C with HTH and peptisase S24 domain
MMRGPLAPPDGSGEPTQPGSRSMPTSTAQSTRSSSQSISSSAKALLSREAPELTDRVGSLEVGQHEDVEELGAGSRSEGVEAFAESTL